MRIVTFVLLGLLSVVGIHNVEVAPKVGGSFTQNLGSEPTTLNPITAVDLYSQTVFSYTIESLLNVDPDTYDWKPGLAEKWEISKDGRTFTFFLRKGAKWHDGKPVTAEDVKFSYDLNFDSKFNAAHRKTYFDLVEKCEIIDPQTIKFTTKELYFKNFEVVSSAIMPILPKHFYQDPKAKGLNKTLMGSGPYKLASYEQGKRIVLERVNDWWGWKDPAFKGEFNFKKLIFRFVKEKTIALEMLKKGELDFLEMSPEDYMQKAVGPEWGKKVLKVKTENKAPKQFGFIGWNLKRPALQDRNTRIALAHLVNRKLMNEKFRYGLSELATGPWHYKSDYASKKVKPIEFDPKKALELLQKAGWADRDKEGKLSRIEDGKKVYLQLTLMTANEDTQKYFTVIKEDARQVGVQIDIKLVEWNTMMKLVDESNFDGAALGWGMGSVDFDPKQIWHSASDIPGGSNFVHYRNSEVDRLIDEARGTMDKAKRIPILQRVFEMIAADAPYVFLFNDKYELYGHSAKVSKPKDTFPYVIGTTYWWQD